jgi:hypothetical protein
MDILCLEADIDAVDKTKVDSTVIAPSNVGGAGRPERQSVQSSMTFFQDNVFFSKTMMRAARRGFC